MPFFRLALFCMLSMFFCQASFGAAYSIEQKVEVKQKGKTNTSKFNWYLDGRKFRLDVSNGKDERSYVFNGRVFYACGKLNTKQLTFFETAINSTEAKSKITSGICQQVSTDFLLRFTLSPYEAIFNNLVGDGIVSHLNVSEAKIGLMGSVGTHFGVSCVNFKRSYKITESERLTYRNIYEKTCHAPSIDWRKNLQRELSKLLLRQTNSRDEAKLVKAEVKKMTGFTLLARFIAKGVGANSEVINQQFDVTTIGLEKKVDRKLLAMPSKFEIIDQTLIKNLAGVKVDSKSVAANKAEPNLAEVLSFFLGGGQPASLFIKSGSPQSERVGH